MTTIPDTWAKVELMGHICLAGKLSEEEKFGSKLARLDIPNGDEFTTQYFGGSAVYRISIVTEEVARHIARNSASAPISPWDYPKMALPAPTRDVCVDCGHDADECDCEEDKETF